MKTVPLAKLNLDKLSNTRLVVYANKHRLAITVAPGLTNFPTPPVPPATLLTLINNYRIALGAAYKGSETQTASKNQAKNFLIQALRQNWQYVNEFTQGRAGDFYNYDQAREFASTSGFDVTKDTEAHFELKSPVVRSVTSPAIGELKVILNKFSKSGRQTTKKVPGAKLYSIQYRTAASGPTPAGPWQASISSAYFHTISGLASGAYEVRVTAIGRQSAITAPSSIIPITVV